MLAFPVIDPVFESGDCAAEAFAFDGGRKDICVSVVMSISIAATIDTSYYPQIPDSINTSKAITGSVSLSTATFQIHLEAA